MWYVCIWQKLNFLIWFSKKQIRYVNKWKPKSVIVRGKMCSTITNNNENINTLIEVSEPKLDEIWIPYGTCKHTQIFVGIFLHFEPKISLGVDFFFILPISRRKKILANFCLYAIKMRDIPSKSQKWKEKKNANESALLLRLFCLDNVYCVGFSIFISKSLTQTPKRTQIRERKEKK